MWVCSERQTDWHITVNQPDQPKVCKASSQAQKDHKKLEHRGRNTTGHVHIWPSREKLCLSICWDLFLKEDLNLGLNAFQQTS